MGRVSDAQPAQVKYKEFSIKLNPQDRYYQNKKALVVVLSRSRLLALDCNSLCGNSSVSFAELRLLLYSETERERGRMHEYKSYHSIS